MTRWPTVTARSGRSTNHPTASAGSTRRAANGSNPLPRYSNLRRVFVDDRTAKVAVWAGNDHDASVIRLEPLD